MMKSRGCGVIKVGFLITKTGCMKPQSESLCCRSSWMFRSHLPRSINDKPSSTHLNAKVSQIFSDFRSLIESISVD